MSTYRFSRVLVGVLQVTGWLIGVAVAAIAVAEMSANNLMKQGHAGSQPQMVGLFLLGLFCAVANHVFWAGFTALFDLAARDTTESSSDARLAGRQSAGQRQEIGHDTTLPAVQPMAAVAPMAQPVARVKSPAEIEAEDLERFKKTGI